MYNNQLAVAIKAAGKVLREQNDKVFLPFGSEYSIYIKNLNTVRALVRVQLDGVDVTDGQDLVVHPNSSIDLERFLKNGNLAEGNRFKFIERTGKVEAHRGIGVEDGLVRVEFQFEKVAPKTIEHDIYHYNHYYYDYWFNAPLGGIRAHSYPYTWCKTVASNQLLGSSVSSCNYSADISSTPTSNITCRSFTATNDINAASVNDAGITVPGSISNQQFTMVSSFPVDETKHVIVLKLLGETKTGAVAEAITVKHKQICPTCGTRNRGKLAQFCRECGTCLEVA
jgi:ribosomal protein L40E